MYVNENLPLHLGGHDNETHLDNGVLNYMIKKYNIKSFLDVGCGPGGMCELAQSKNLKVLGIDGDFTLKHNHPAIIHDYTNGSPEINEHYDLCWSCEFVEHVEEQYAKNFIETFKKAKYIIITHAVPGQWGHHHVNCQPYTYWKDLLFKDGLKFSASESLKIRDLSTMKANHIKRSGMFFVNQNI